MDAHLLFKTDTFDGIACAKATIRFNHKLRHDEKRDAARTCGRIRQARQDQVYDVLGDIMIAPCDEYLLPTDGVAAIFLRHGSCLERANIRTGLRLRQIHGAGPIAGHEVGKICLLLVICAVRQQGLNCAEAEHRAEPERHVGRVEHFHDRQGERLRQALPAPFLWRRQAHPSTLPELGVGISKSRRGPHPILGQYGTVRVARCIERRQYITCQLVGFFQDRRDQLGVIIAECLQPFQSGQARNGLERERHIVERSVIGHVFLPESE